MQIEISYFKFGQNGTPSFHFEELQTVGFDSTRGID